LWMKEKIMHQEILQVNNTTKNISFN